MNIYYLLTCFSQAVFWPSVWWYCLQAWQSPWRAQPGQVDGQSVFVSFMLTDLLDYLCWHSA